MKVGNTQEQELECLKRDKKQVTQNKTGNVQTETYETYVKCVCLTVVQLLFL